MKTKIIKVRTKSKNYEVHIGTNIISKLRNIIKKNKLSFSKCLIVIDSKIPKKFRTILLGNLNDQKVTLSGVDAPEVIPTLIFPVGRKLFLSSKSDPSGLCNIEFSLTDILSGVSI